jgi:rubrerythrin
MSTSDTSKEGECEEVEDDVVNFSVIEAAWHELISQKQRSASDSHSSDRLRDQILRTLMQDQQALDCAIAPACTRAANLDTHLPTSVQEQEPLDAGDYTDEEVLNHFAGFDRNFLSDIQGALEEMGVDVGDMEKIAIFDIQKLFSKFGSQFGLVKQWQNKIREAWEQAKRMEEELAQKQRAKRPKWRCAICGRPFCRVAPYIEGYEDVEV